MGCTAVSSSGKVLLAGGYLVLDPNYSAIVVSTSSRFYAVIRPAQPSVKDEIHVRSPQFLDAVWHYSAQWHDGKISIQNKSDLSTNPFVQLALQCTLSFAVEVKGSDAIQAVLVEGTCVDILGDNDFYSQTAKLDALGLPRTLDSLSKIPPFNPTGVPLPSVHKTGLGSSAALIASLVSALLVHLAVITPTALSDPQGEARRLAHNLAQFVHCLAQGKVGSGFDVSAAVFGSQIYTRFSPDVIKHALNDDTRTGPLLPIVSPSNTAWAHQVLPFKLPPLTRLMLADVDAGSDTPSFVRQVLKWRSEHSSEAHALWTAIDQWNRSLAITLTALCDMESRDPECYRDVVKYLSTLQPLQWFVNPGIFPQEVPIVKAFYEVHRITNAIRTHMRKMGEAASVPIEPPEQTKLLDVCVTQAGVIGGGVPGAGGYDAIWLLVTDPLNCDEQERPLRRVEYVWKTWKDMNVTPLATADGGTKGVVVEDVEKVPGLKEAILSP